jgi:hypothetical protein
MPLVANRKVSGAGTHALLIGIGDYPSLGRFSYSAPRDSVIAFWRWLETEFRNDAAPLATVDVLISGPGNSNPIELADWPVNALFMERGEGAYRPTHDNVRKAVAGFVDRVRSNPGDLAFVYLGGLGYLSPGKEPTLLFDDAGTADLLKSGAASLSNIVTFIESLSDNRVIWVVDTLGLAFDALVALDQAGFAQAARPPALIDTMPVGSSPRVLAISATTVRTPQVNPTPILAATLMTLFRQGRRDTGWVNARDVSQAVQPTIASLLGSRPSFEVPPEVMAHCTGDFRITLPPDPASPEMVSLDRTPPDPPPEEPGETVAGAGGEAPAVPAPKDPGKRPRKGAGAKATRPAKTGKGTMDTAREPPGPETSSPAGQPASGGGSEPPPPETAPSEPPETARDKPRKPSETPSETPVSDLAPDDAESERDELGRAGLAIVLAHKLHEVWRRANAYPQPAGGETRAAFVVHLDAPWGGGKTTFANFLAHVLNPLPGGARQAALFLRQRFPNQDLGGAFIRDPSPDPAVAADLRLLPADARRPWIVVNFNAWQAEHCAPPWWLFYQAIRKGCFDAIRTEGDAAWAPRPADWKPWRVGLDRGWRGVRGWLGGKLAWVSLMLSEYGWRLFNPKIFSLIATALIGVVALLVLKEYGVWDRAASGSAGFVLTSGAGLLAAGLTGVGAIWGLGALVTESIVPGTSTLAERLSLGNGDPFARFRTHFARTMEGVRRPVMVVVDDLDRCRPDFVVDLIRGIQTLLRSPRVVFVILGDRDWIERAFEAHHEKMREIDVGPEQRFGARFVEKAIQMSFILPALAPDSQRAYLRRVLLGQRADAGKPAPEVDAMVVAEVNAAVEALAARPGFDPFESARMAEEVMREVWKGDARQASESAPTRDEVRQVAAERLASRIVIHQDLRTEVAHHLEPLSAFFPANPRQIKRIVNAVTLYYGVAVALQEQTSPGAAASPSQQAVGPDRDFAFQLALWVIIMTEWPRTWRLFASFPDLVDLVSAPDRIDEAGLMLPGSKEATRKALAAIDADPDLKALITGAKADGVQSHAALETAYVRRLAELTPLHSRKRRLPEETPPPAPSSRRAKST